MRRLLVEILSTGGFNVIEAISGVEALQIVEQTGVAIDLLLTDLVMPEMNGFQLAERLWKLRGETRTVFISGYDDTTIRGLGFDQLVAVFVRKPFTIEELTVTVHNLLNLNREV